VLWYNHVNACHAYRLSRNLAGQIDVFSPFLFCALAREKWRFCVGPALVCVLAFDLQGAAADHVARRRSSGSDRSSGGDLQTASAIDLQAAIFRHGSRGRE
jgi:hypothetical protein